MADLAPELDFCLLIPCYNNKAGLLHSLATVKYQPNRFLVVVVDDGSKEPLKKEDITVDLPVVVIRIENNRGITHALNTGLEWIDKNQPAKYIARLDCDDTCDPERFYFQVEHMNANPQVGLSGTWCVFEEVDGSNRYHYKTPTNDKDIRRSMYFRNVFIHPTVIFKKELLKKTGYYPSTFELVEDYALFWKMMQQTQTLVVGKFLVTCRINKSGISYRNRSKQLIARQKVVNYYGKNLFLKVIAKLRLAILFLIPKRLLLPLKNLKG
jgi:glycosyltransferase involved in cell wall biosynthesis